MLADWWIAMTMLAAAAALLLLGTRQDRTPPRVSRRFAEALKDQGMHLKSHVWLEREDGKARWLNRLERFSSGELEEMQRLLVQAGWGNQSTRLYMLAAAWVGPLASGLLAGMYAGMAGKEGTEVLSYMLFGFALVFVGMRRVLRWRAAQRRRAIRGEVVTLLHLLRMLFDAGLSLEHTLQVIDQQARSLIPNMAAELGVALARIKAGQDRADALSDMAAPLEVPELSDTVAMLKQVTRYGGNVRDALVEYTKLVEQRQISELREYVSKLSAKMTVVMVVFLFPALMIFIAGPGFIGLASALKGAQG